MNALPPKTQTEWDKPQDSFSIFSYLEEKSKAFISLNSFMVCLSPCPRANDSPNPTENSLFFAEYKKKRLL